MKSIHTPAEPRTTIRHHPDNTNEHSLVAFLRIEFERVHAKLDAQYEKDGPKHTWTKDKVEMYHEDFDRARLKLYDSFLNVLHRLQCPTYFSVPCETIIGIPNNLDENLLSFGVVDGDGKLLMNGGILFRDGEVTLHT